MFVLVLFFQLATHQTGWAADCFWLENALDGALHKKECVLEKEDITSSKELRPDDFWKRIGQYVERERSLKRQPDAGIMEHPLFRIYYFGNFPVALFNPNISKGMEDSAAYLLSLSAKKQDNLLGRPVSERTGELVVAGDIPFEPILKGHRGYSDRYYPRTMGKYALTFLEGFYLTNDKNYERRFYNMIDYLIYSQFKKDGQNQFVRRFCTQEKSGCQPIDKKTDILAWAGGFDYLFDWKWKDAYGYQWQLHEPDHHVNSINSVSLVKGFELSKDKKYLNAAYEFVYNQIPRYGYHTGIWRNQRYYWTEYDPSGEGNPTDDATDNVQSLVAWAVATVGYYTNNQTMLEYARGLLWYNLREFNMDSRWLYDGAENKLNKRRSVSHDGSVLKAAIETLPYLIKAGMNVKDLVDGYYDAFIQYLDYDNPRVSKIIWNVGSVGKKTDKDVPADRAYLSAFRSRGWKTFSQKPKINEPVRVTYFFQINDDDVIQKKDKLLLLDRLFHELKPGSKITLSKRSFTSAPNQPTAILTTDKKTTKINDVFLKIQEIKKGDVIELSFEWIPESPNVLTYKSTNFELLAQDSGQGKQDRVSSQMHVLDPDTGCTTDLFQKFSASYFLPRE